MISQNYFNIKIFPSNTLIDKIAHVLYYSENLKMASIKILGVRHESEPYQKVKKGNYLYSVFRLCDKSCDEILLNYKDTLSGDALIITEGDFWPNLIAPHNSVYEKMLEQVSTYLFESELEPDLYFGDTRLKNVNTIEKYARNLNHVTNYLSKKITNANTIPNGKVLIDNMLNNTLATPEIVHSLDFPRKESKVLKSMELEMEDHIVKKSIQYSKLYENVTIIVGYRHAISMKINFPDFPMEIIVPDNEFDQLSTRIDLYRDIIVSASLK